MKQFVLAALKTLLLMTAALLPLLFTRPAYALESLFNIGITKFERVGSATIETTAINVYADVYGEPVYTFESSAGFTLTRSGEGIALSRSGEVLCASDGAMLIRGAEGTTKIGGRTYRGFLKPVKASALLTLVNVINAEEYLYGVVPAEMPSSWHKEALKAQAVAARSYAYTQAGVHADRGFDLCDTTCCQYYPGMANETTATTDAVNQTAGKLAYYNGQPINAVFASSSGGNTENSENVWPEALQYLRGVKETNEKEFMEWTRSYNLQTIAQGLKAKGLDVGTLTSVTAEYYPSGRVAKLTFNGSSGAKSVTKDAVRGVTSEIGGSLPSAAFKINGYAWSQNGMWDAGSSGGETVYVLGESGQAQPKSTSQLYAGGAAETIKPLPGAVSVLGDGGTKAYGAGGTALPSGGQNTFTITSNTITLEGRGYGHGVGMSQYGAKGMAEAGYDFVQILKHYFTGIEVY